VGQEEWLVFEPVVGAGVVVDGVGFADVVEVA
jgi:hypothetical protein